MEKCVGIGDIFAVDSLGHLYQSWYSDRCIGHAKTMEIGGMLVYPSNSAEGTEKLNSPILTIIWNVMVLYQ